MAKRYTDNKLYNETITNIDEFEKGKKRNKLTKKFRKVVEKMPGAKYELSLRFRGSSSFSSGLFFFIPLIAFIIVVYQTIDKAWNKLGVFKGY